MTRAALVGLVLLAGRAEPAAAQERAAPQLQQVTVVERQGNVLPLELGFRDHDGHPVRLGDVFSDGRPVLLVLAYYDCRTLCDLVLASVARALAASGLQPGTDFRALTVSIDPWDRPEDAREARSHVLAVLGGESEWAFLVGEEGAIRTLAESLGFGYALDPASGQYAHPAVVFAITPGGRISSYVYGTTFEADELARALQAAAAGTVRTTTALERVLLRCFHYVPALRRYAGLIEGVLRTGGLLTVLLFGGLLARLWRREWGRGTAG